jgi:hypothetical protein
MTRARVARRIGTSTRRVRVIERRALARLRAAGRAGACGGGGGSPAAGTTGAGVQPTYSPLVLTGLGTASVLQIMSSAPAEVANRDVQDVLGASASATAAEKARAIARGMAAVTAGSDDDSGDGGGGFPWGLGVLALVAVLVGLIVIASRRGGGPRTASGPDPGQASGWLPERRERGPR